MTKNHSIETHKDRIEQCKDIVCNTVRDAMADRALYLLFIKRELEKSKAVDVDSILSRAVFAYGKYKGRGKVFASADEFLDTICTPISQHVMDAKVLQKSEQRVVLREHYCPLYRAWKEAGCDQNEITGLCRIADWVDRGMIDNSPLNVEFSGNMQEKGQYCQMDITLKSQSV